MATKKYKKVDEFRFLGARALVSSHANGETSENQNIAHWLGHSDGGVLVGKVHGHLADEHKKRMADNLSILKTPANVVRISA